MRVSASPTSSPAASTTPTAPASACGDVVIGAGAPIVVMAGPCAVESREQLMATARWVKREGATDPAWRRLQAAHLALRLPGPGGRRASSSWPRSREETGLPIVTEVTDPADVPVFERLRRHAPGRRPEHAELRAAQGRRPEPASRCCSSAACRRPSRSGSWPPSTSSPSGNPNVVLVRARHPDASRRPPATRSTSPPCRCSGSGPTCRSWSTRRTARATGRWSGRWPWPAPPRAPTGSSSRSTPIRPRPGPTPSSRSPSPSSAT